MPLHLRDAWATMKAVGGSCHPDQYAIAEEDGHDHRRATGD